MARARNIKPSFFKNELLAEMDAFDRLLFIGLWCLADREGRIEDRPKRIKMELFPCDTYDVNAGLDQLTKHGFLRRYQAGDAAVVSIVNFHKHQTPHGTEKDSELPDETGALTVHDRSENGYVTGKKRRNNVKPEQSTGRERLGDSVRPVKTQGENTLNPDSLNPDSLKEAKASLSPSAKSPRGTALPETWTLPDDWKTWAEGARPDVDVLTVADSFRDYWVAKPGKDGRKADWLATWRNWVRNQRSGSAQRPQSAAAVGAFI